MDRMTRGNVLATIKELKKSKRPHARTYTSAPAVQAICSCKGVSKSNKEVSLDTLVCTSGVGLNASTLTPSKIDTMDEFEKEFEAFMAKYRANS